MRIVWFRHWQLDVDPQATRQAYAAISQGPGEPCGCETCRNFAAARDQLYPPHISAFLDQLGINREHEIELYHLARLPSGLHEYGGWFHAVGQIITGPDAHQQISATSFWLDLERVTEHLAMGCSASIALAPAAFATRPLIQAEVPWLINQPEPD